MDTSEDGRRRRRRHSAEFKAKVVAACLRPGVSIAAVALSNRLNANLLRRWLVDAQRPQAMSGTSLDTGVRSPTTIDEHRFVPVTVERTLSGSGQEIAIEIRHGATLVKVGWPLSAAADCAAWLRELLR